MAPELNVNSNGRTTSSDRRSSMAAMPPSERRRKLLVLTLLVLLLALLAFSTYYFVRNRKLPTIEFRSEQVQQIEPPQYLFSITGQGAASMDRPVGVGVSSTDRVFVVDFGKRRISAYDKGGRYLFSFNKAAGGEVLGSPVHLWVQDDEVWVTDRRKRVISVFDLDGRFKRTFEPKGEKLDWTPLALALDGEGQLRVTDVGNTSRHRVLYFSADGSRTATFGRTAQARTADSDPAGFLFPNGIAVAGDGRVYISDGDNRRVQVFSAQGEFKGFVDTSGVPRGIAIDDEERLYVADALAHTVDVYDLAGKRLTRFGGQGFGPGQFNYPNDIAIGPDGRIYVTDRENDQVQVWGWPEAELPKIAAPTDALGWTACLSPLLLLPFLLLLRKIRYVVTPQFLEVLIAGGYADAVVGNRRIRLVAPLVLREEYEATIDSSELDRLVEFEVHSESDERELMHRLEVTSDEAVMIVMAKRVRGLGVEEPELRRAAVLAGVPVLDVEAFVARHSRSRR